MVDTLRIKRRPVGGAAGAPSQLAAAEIAYNEVDDTLYYGKGNSGGLATNIVPIGGSGAFVTVAQLTGGLPAIGFRASKTGSQTGIPNSAYTKVTFDIEDYDRGNYYNPALSRWTPPAGIVHLDASLYVSGITANTAAYVNFFKNGSSFKQAGLLATSGTDTQFSLDDNANGTDYYEVFVYLGTTGTATVVGGLDASFSGHVVSAQGPQGPLGPQGSQGVQGIQGVQGVVGPVGGPGPAGPPATYPTGAHGFTGQKTANQLIPSATWTKLDFGSEVYDTGNQFDLGLSRYTPVAGDAFFVASVYCSGTLAGSNVYLAIYKNGTLFRAATNNTTNGTAQIVCADNASGTDYYEAWVYAYTVSGTFTVPVGENNLVFFQGFQPVGPAGPMGPAGFGIVQIMPTPPSAPSVGNFWYDTSTGILSVWIDDLSSQQWVQVSPTINLDTSLFVGINSPAFTGTPTAPTAPAGTNTTQVATTAFVQAAIAIPKQLFGLTLANNGTTALNIDTGGATSDDNTTTMILSAASFTKNCNAAWAVGSGNGAKDTAGALAASTWYHVFLIERTDTFVVDVLISTSVSAPSMPSSYTKKRRIGSIKTDASANILPFVQLADEVLWAITNTWDIAANAGGTTAGALFTSALVPPGVKVIMIVNTVSNIPAAYGRIGSPDEGAGGAGSWNFGTSGSAAPFGAQYRIRTNTAQQIFFQAGAAFSPGLFLGTIGYVDNRGK